MNLKDIHGSTLHKPSPGEKSNDFNPTQNSGAAALLPPKIAPYDQNRGNLHVLGKFDILKNHKNNFEPKPTIKTIDDVIARPVNNKPLSNIGTLGAGAIDVVKNHVKDTALARENGLNTPGTHVADSMGTKGSGFGVGKMPEITDPKYSGMFGLAQYSKDITQWAKEHPAEVAVLKAKSDLIAEGKNAYQDVLTGASIIPFVLVGGILFVGLMVVL